MQSLELVEFISNRKMERRQFRQILNKLGLNFNQNELSLGPGVAEQVPNQMIVKFAFGLEQRFYADLICIGREEWLNKWTE